MMRRAGGCTEDCTQILKTKCTKIARTQGAGLRHGQGQPGGVRGSCEIVWGILANTMCSWFSPQKSVIKGQFGCSGGRWASCFEDCHRVSKAGAPLAPASSSGELFGLAMGCRWVDSTSPTALSRSRQLQQLAHGGAAVVPVLCACQLFTDMESRNRCNDVGDGPSQGLVSQWCKRSTPPAAR